MNKIFLALFFTLAVASAQDFLELDGIDTAGLKIDIFSCISDVSAVVPILIQLTQDVKGKKGFDAIQADLKALIGHVNKISQDCGIPQPKGKSGPVDVQKCITDASLIVDDARIVVEAAKTKNILNIFVGLQAIFSHLPNARTDCGLIAQTFVDEDVAKTNKTNNTNNTNKTQPNKTNNTNNTPSNNTKPIKIDIFLCISDVSAVVPILTQLTQDVKGKKGFDAIQADLKAIIGNVNKISQHCGIPQPKGKSGPVDVQKCLTDAAQIADDAHIIVEAAKTKNVANTFVGLQSLLNHIKDAIPDCGLVAK